MNKNLKNTAMIGITGIAFLVSGCAKPLPVTKQEAYNNCVKDYVDKFATKNFEAELIMCDSAGNHFTYEKMPHKYCEPNIPLRYYTRK